MLLQLGPSPELIQFNAKVPGDYPFVAPYPVLVVLHDAPDTALTVNPIGADGAIRAEQASGLEELVRTVVPDREPWVVVFAETYPLGPLSSWNLTHFGPVVDLNRGVLEVQAIYEYLGTPESNMRSELNRRRLVAPHSLEASTPLPADLFDRSRIHLLGIGAGGTMAYAMAVSRRDPAWPIASITVVNGTLGGMPGGMHPRQIRWDPAAGADEVSILAVRCTLDTNVAASSGPSDAGGPVYLGGNLSHSSFAEFFQEFVPEPWPTRTSMTYDAVTASALTRWDLDWLAGPNAWLSLYGETVLDERDFELVDGVEIAARHGLGATNRSVHAVRVPGLGHVWPDLPDWPFLPYLGAFLRDNAL